MANFPILFSHLSVNVNKIQNFATMVHLLVLLGERHPELDGHRQLSICV